MCRTLLIYVVRLRLLYSADQDHSKVNETDYTRQKLVFELYKPSTAFLGVTKTKKVLQHGSTAADVRRFLLLESE